MKCDSCRFNFGIEYTKFEDLSEGETVLFHLAKGEKREFHFSPSNKNFNSVDITSYNIKMSDFDMKVKICNWFFI